MASVFAVGFFVSRKPFAVAVAVTPPVLSVLSVVLVAISTQMFDGVKVKITRQ